MPRSKDATPLSPEELEIQAIQEKLKKALSEYGQGPFYCSGKFEVAPLDLILYYGEEDKTRRITLPNANGDKVKALAEACTKATFGMAQEDILDETYRKAGKMDVDCFALNFNPTSTGLLDRVRDDLLGLEPGMRNIRAELYKLNVYGPGSFFKSHVDTPRGETMFGSLVVVLPTAHEGGALHLRHHGKEFVHDSTLVQSAFPGTGNPSVVYVAFYSDVEHEVAEVTSGYRVTLTYNLYFKDTTLARPPTPSPDETVSSLLGDLLSQSAFLPEGGLIGFGLTHKYPIPQLAGKERSAPIAPLLNHLKGADVHILSVLKHLGLEHSLYVVYNLYDAIVMSQNVLSFKNSWQGHGPIDIALEEGAVMMVDKYLEPEARRPVTWILPMTRLNKIEAVFLAYGNDASLEHVYGNLALVVQVGKPGERSAIVPLKGKKLRKRRDEEEEEYEPSSDEDMPESG
ncbi:hypothetical protein BOTBODRAFT_171175 [Botryobasidium botryosum FD-172 SS1]|uniref:Fe2OG dioxygenase domain-containing protein n=1 Tax=Botryobasidium botryosum (strain FD-172 SS1) TaxID=930990 RepID=A0A067MRI2_BOTB1|nr:hypothetical protein BOTBODRAFT_171175 [Botryobasidium botryosum FD-172 SS1]